MKRLLSAKWRIGFAMTGKSAKVDLIVILALANLFTMVRLPYSAPSALARNDKERKVKSSLSAKGVAFDAPIEGGTQWRGYK